jgi:predicted acylesterase/phospholipase RssA
MIPVAEAAHQRAVAKVTSMMLKAIELGTRKRVRELGERADLLVRPAVQRFSLTDVTKCDELIEVGYRDGLDALRTWLRDNPGVADTVQPK